MFWSLEELKWSLYQYIVTNFNLPNIEPEIFEKSEHEFFLNRGKNRSNFRILGQRMGFCADKIWSQWNGATNFGTSNTSRGFFHWSSNSWLIMYFVPNLTLSVVHCTKIQGFCLIFTRFWRKFEIGANSGVFEAPRKIGQFGKYARNEDCWLVYSIDL